MANTSADNLSLFKEMPGGFIYRARHPWLFGPGTHYFVTVVQREEILARSEEPSATRAAVWMVALIVVALVVSLLFISYRHGYQLESLFASDVAIVMSATLVAMLVAIKITLNPMIKSLEPLLATLPKSEQKISLYEYRTSLMKVSTAAELRKRAWLFFVLAALSWLDVFFPHRFAIGVLSGSVFWTVKIVVAAALTVLGAHSWWRATQRSA